MNPIKLSDYIDPFSHLNSIDEFKELKSGGYQALVIIVTALAGILLIYPGVIAFRALTHTFREIEEKEENAHLSKTISKTKEAAGNSFKITANPDVNSIAKELRVDKKYVKRAIEKGQLPEFTQEIQKALLSYESKFDHFDKENKKLVQQKMQKETGITAKQLMKITAKAFFLLGENQSILMQMGFFKSPRLVTKNPGGELTISKKIKTLGKGSYGKVKLYLAETTGKIAVIKFARKRLKRDQSERNITIQDVLNEYTLTLEIGGQRGIQDKPHKIVIIISKTGEVLKTGYMRPDYDGDGSLLINDRQNPEITGDKALDLMHQLFCGLDTLQQKHIAHKDIKPWNLLIRREGDQIVAHLADFGGAKKLDARAPLDHFLDNSYAKFYVHPQDLDRVKEVRKELRKEETSEDQRSQLKETYRSISNGWDVYSTTMTLYQILSGGIRYNPNAPPGSRNSFDASRLIALNIPLSVISLMEQALDSDYSKRPLPRDFLNLIEAESPQLALQNI